jgi:hypothetical protein
MSRPLVIAVLLSAMINSADAADRKSVSQETLAPSGASVTAYAANVTLESQSGAEKDKPLGALLQSFLSSIVHSKPASRLKHLMIGGVFAGTCVSVVYKNIASTENNLQAFVRNCNILFGLTKVSLLGTAALQAFQYVLPPDDIEPKAEKTFVEKLKSGIHISPDVVLGLGICILSALVIYSQQQPEDLLTLFGHKMPSVTVTFTAPLNRGVVPVANGS